jgi:hypothetical protein
MDPVTLIVVPGFLGGLVIALLFFWWQRRSSAPPVVPSFHPEQPSTDIINVSSIKVAGIGGLGLVAMAAAVALDVPRIGQTLAIGAVCGAIIAAVMIYRRRSSGSLPSSSQRMGANTTLSIDAPPAAKTDVDDGRPLTPKRLSVVPSR